MYDQHSTDDSRELAEKLGMEVRLFGGPELNDQAYLNVKNHCWKEQRGRGVNYVIVVDADEFVCIDELRGTAPKVMGYNMISETLPVNDVLEITTGMFSESYSKQAIFSPDEIIEIDYGHGCHINRMKGKIISTGNCRLLHYRMIGGVERIIQRHSMYRSRMSAFNKQHGMGIHYTHSDENKRVEWQHLKNGSEVLF